MPFRTFWPRAVGFGLAFLLCAEIGRFLSVEHYTYVSFWLPAGLYVGTLLRHETGRWPGLMLAALVANFTFDLAHGTSFWTTVGFYCANTAEAVTGAWLVRRWVSPQPRLTSLGELARLFLLAGGVGPVAGATIGAATMKWSGMADSFWSAWPVWWGGELMAVLTVTPLVLLLAPDRVRTRMKFSWRWQYLEAALLTGGMTYAAWHILALGEGIDAAYRARLMVFVLWAGLRFGVRGAVAVNLWLALLTAFFTTHYLRGFTVEQIASGDYIPSLQGFLTVCAMVGLIPSVVIAERDRKVEELAESEERFRHLTHAAFEGICIVHDSRIADVNDQTLKMFGCDRSAMVGREAIDFVAPESLAAAMESMQAESGGVIECRLLRPDGATFDAEVRGRNVEVGGRRVRMIALLDITERKRIEEALKASERRFRRVLEMLPTAAYTCDGEGRITFFNRQATLIWGRSPRLNDLAERFCGSFKLFTLEGAAISHDRCWMAVSLAEQRPVLGNAIVIERPDGSRVTALAHASPLFDSAGELMGAVNVLTDISELRKAKSALAASEALLRQFIKHAPAAVAMFDTDMRYLQTSERWITDYQLEGQELIGRSHYDLFPHLPAWWRQVHRRVLAGMVERCAQDPFMRPDGTMEWLEWEIRPWRKPDGEIGGVIMFTQLITGRKQIEEAQRQNQKKLVLAMQMARLGHWEFNLLTRQFTFNADFYQLFRTTPEAQGGLVMSAEDYTRKFLHPEDTRMVSEQIAMSRAATDPEFTQQIEHRFLRADGSQGVMSVHLAIVKDEAGNTVKTYGVNQDITERKLGEQQQKKLEEQLRQAQKMEALGTLAGGTAHEFNNILGIILAYGEVAKADVEAGHPVHASLDEILKAGQRAREIVEQILAFSRQQKQKRTLMSLPPVILDAVKVVRATLPATVEIQTEFQVENAAILGNPTQIHQVITNICQNAAHALEGHPGRIHITKQRVKLDGTATELHPALQPGDYLRLSIADNGKGMDAATQARIFEPFFTTKGPGKGSGLGLAVVHGIMQSHEGAVVVQSQPGQGATFHLYFPARGQVLPAPASISDASIPLGQGQHILVVDDEPALAFVAVKLLERLGYRASKAASGDEAFALFEQTPGAFDLVLTDLTMPGMTGLDLADALYLARPDLPVILATGFDGARTADPTRGQGIRQLLQKPFTPEVLARSVHRVLHEDVSACKGQVSLAQ